MNNNSLELKYNKLKGIIRGYGSVVVGLSGGVDSALLARVSYDVLSSNAISAIGISHSYPLREELYSIELARLIGIAVIKVSTDEMEVESYRLNRGDRCYFCKKELYQKLLNLKEERNINYVIDGTNASDVLSNDRPGILALKELGIKMPLLEAALHKEDIRSLSKLLGLPSWDKPSFACLSSRVPVGTEISKDILKKIELGEDILYNMGFRQFRLRYHKDIARIELEAKDFTKLLSSSVRSALSSKIKALGFRYITLDLNPYIGS